MNELDNRGREPGIDEETNRSNERPGPPRSAPDETKPPRRVQEYPGESVTPDPGEKRGGSKPSGEDVDSGNE